MTTTPNPDRPLTDRERLAYAVLLEPFLQRVADAGYGRVERAGDTLRVEAYPGLEHAAADHLGALLMQEEL